MGFLEYKIELVCFVSITEDTEIIVDSIDDDVEEDEFGRTGTLIDGVESWDWLCF